VTPIIYKIVSFIAVLYVLITMLLVRMEKIRVMMNS
jgi:hypothetical protein